MSLAAQVRTQSRHVVGLVVVAALRHQYVKDLLKALRKRGLTREDSQDLQNEACLRLFVYARTHPVNKPNGLLRRMILYLWINSVTRDKSVARKNEGAAAFGDIPDGRAGPERILAAEQEVARVADLLSATSTRTCQIFIAHRGGYTYEEVAAAFAIRPRTVEKHIATAEELLLEHMGLVQDAWPPAPGPYSKRRQLQGLGAGRKRSLARDPRPQKTDERPNLKPIRPEIFPADSPRYPKAERSGKVAPAEPCQLQEPAARITGPPYSGDSAGSWGIRELHVLTAAPSRLSSDSGEGGGGGSYGPDDDHAK